jgi:hypothetical protein
LSARGLRRGRIGVLDQVVQESGDRLDDVVRALPGVVGVGGGGTGPDGRVPRLVMLGHAVDANDDPCPWRP